MSIISAGTSNTTSIVYTGDTTGNLVFQTNGTTEAMRITAGQKVGIGVTPSGSYILEVNGNPNLNSVGGVYLTCGTWDAIKNPSASILAFGGVTSSQWDTAALYTSGTERLRTDSTGQVLVNSTSLFDPDNYSASGAKFLQIKSTTTDRGSFLNLLGGGGGAGGYWLGGINFAVSGQTYPGARIISGTGASTGTSGQLLFHTSSDTTAASSERMRITSTGDLIVNDTTSTSHKVSITAPTAYGALCLTNGSTNGYYALRIDNPSTNHYAALFRENGTNVGTIITTSSTTAYNTSSDYRLKKNVLPMTGALNTVAQLKPCTYKWKIDDSDGQGFIAHELAEVVPQAVSGTKDEVDDEGNPRYQGVDTSFLVATLTAAIQELKAIVDTQATEIAALKAKVGN